MRKFFKDNIWLFALVAAILVIQGILGYYRKNQVAEMSIIPRKGEFIMLSDYEDMIFKQLYCQLSNSDSDLHLLLEEIRKEDDRTPSYLRNVKELEDKSLLHMVVYGDEHEEIFNEGLTDYRWLVEEVTYKIGYSGETVFVTISHTY